MTVFSRNLFSRPLRLAILFAALLLTGCATLPPPPIAPAASSRGVSAAGDVADLLGIEWQLVEIHQSGDQVLVVDDPSDYTLAFDKDGRFSGQLQCNRMSGSYELDGGKLVFGPIATTRAFCPEDTIFPVYSQALSSALSYAIVDGQLHVTFDSPGGLLVYAPAPEPAADADFSEVDLANATYAGIYDEPVTLTDGAYAGEPFVAGGASRPTVNLLPETTATGDLNGDGLADGAAVLVENSGGSGSFVYLAALVADGGIPATGVTLLLGDRVQVESVAIVDGQIELVAATFADSDPMCCPSLRTRFIYALEQGALVELSADADFSEVDLSNATYAGIYDEPVTLTDGAYAGEPFVAGGASRPTVNLLPETTATGDLNGDGLADGAAVLVENSGGSGSFVYLAALVADGGTPATGVTLLLGDRVQVESVAIVDGQIELVAATFVDSDPMCCPSLRTHFVFGLQDGALVELSAEKM